MTLDARKFERKATKLEGRLKGPDGSGIDHPCDVVELSAGGVRIKISKATDISGDATLSIGELGTYAVTVIWSRPPLMGLQFQDSPEAMAEVVMAVALYR